ncbi:hypothetical protein A2U01_0036984, partial [Trifolium medium]|nr:hypothetical protein [Trifolium medium]
GEFWVRLGPNSKLSPKSGLASLGESEARWARMMILRRARYVFAGRDSYPFLAISRQEPGNILDLCRCSSLGGA